MCAGSAAAQAGAQFRDGTIRRVAAKSGLVGTSRAAAFGAMTGAKRAKRIAMDIRLPHVLPARRYGTIEVELEVQSTSAPGGRFVCRAYRLDVRGRRGALIAAPVAPTMERPFPAPRRNWTRSCVSRRTS